MSDDLSGLAAMTFEPIPATVLPSFVQQAASVHKALVAGMGLVTVTPEKMAEGMRALLAAEGEDGLVRAVEDTYDTAEWLTGAADAMRTLAARMIAVTMRVTEGGA